MTNLTASQIALISAELTGAEPTRTATKERAIAKLRAAIAERIGEDKADAILAQALDAPTSEAASAILRGEEDARVEDAAPKQRRAALDLIEAEAPAPEAKPAREKKPRAPKADKPQGKRASILEALQRGELPPAPDFSAETHKRFRAKLAEVIAAAEAGDIAALRAFEINPVSSSPKAIDRYRLRAILALEARAAGNAAA